MEISKDTLVAYHHIKRETQLTYHRYLTTNCDCCPTRPDAKLTFPDGRPLEELLTSAERDRNAEAAVEAAVRIIADQGDDQRMIHILWTRFDPDARPRRMSRTTRGHGLSLLAWIYLEGHRMFKDEDEDKEMSDAALRYAQMFAESCAQIGFVSQVVLNVGAATVATANRRAFAAYPHLRAAYEDYLKQLSRKGRPVLDNFACTAGCGVYASKLAGLRRCTGACPPTHKAYYCTKECQKIDWPRLKLVCRPDATAADVAALPPPLYTQEEDHRLRRSTETGGPDPHLTIFKGRMTNNGEVPVLAECDRWKALYSIDMGAEEPSGNHRLVTSSNLSARTLKQVRYQLDPAGPFAGDSDMWVTDEEGITWLRIRVWI